MNFIKDSLLHLREFSLTTQLDERVIVHNDKVQVRGNMHSLLPSNFSSPLSAAFVASAATDGQTIFFLYVGGMKLPIVYSMTLHPSLDATLEDDHDRSISINTREGKHVIVKLSTSELFLEWHHAFAEAMAELIFSQAFKHNSTGTLSAQRLEVAMRRASRLVPVANCHWLRAKRLWNVKIELQEILRRLEVDIHSITRDHVRNFILNSEIDRVSLLFCDSKSASYCIFPSVDSGRHRFSKAQGRGAIAAVGCGLPAIERRLPQHLID